MTSGKNYLSFEIKKDPKSMTSEELEDLLKFSKFETFSKKNFNILSSRYPQKQSPPRIIISNDLQKSYSINDLKKSRDFNIDDQTFFHNKPLFNDFNKQTTMVEETNQRFFIDKLKEIQNENEELKESLKKTKEIYEKEKQEMKNSFLRELNMKNHIENEYSSVHNNSDKQTLLRNEIIYLKNSLDLSEKEKIKHLEQNIIEKEQLIKEINSLKREIENIKKIMKDITSKNNTLTQNDLIHEKTIADLRQQIFELKKTLSKSTSDYKNIIDDLKISFENEKNELLNKKEILEVIVREHENDHKKLVFSYEKQIREMRKEIAKFDKNKSKAFLTKSLLNFNFETKIPKMTKNSHSSSVNSKYHLTKSSSTSDFKANKQKANNVFNNNLSNLKVANNNTDLSYVSHSKKHSMYLYINQSECESSPKKVNSVQDKEEIMKVNNTRNNSMNKDKSLKLNTNENIYQDRLSGINDQIFNLERINVELKRTNINLEKEVMQKFNEEEKMKIQEKIRENNEIFKKNNAKLYELKSQQKNVLMLSLNF